jgi:hypothetical protein
MNKINISGYDSLKKINTLAAIRKFNFLFIIKIHHDDWPSERTRP